MRRSWPIVVATLALVSGGGLAVSSSAANAASGPGGGTVIGSVGGLVQPGGPVSLTTTARVRMGGQIAPTVIPSANWAGYVATGASGGYTSVSSSWTEPSGQCSQGNQYSAFWVGLDGYSSTTVEQTGSEVDCVNNTPKYSA